uniref:UPF0176_N domain-containing protein n=1 Tax=Rhabditophanes sp. KR3021 TaxID=114890 RepID=A0AC35TJT7_9BILA
MLKRMTGSSDILNSIISRPNMKTNTLLQKLLKSRANNIAISPKKNEAFMFSLVIFKISNDLISGTFESKRFVTLDQMLELVNRHGYNSGNQKRALKIFLSSDVQVNLKFEERSTLKKMVDVIVKRFANIREFLFDFEDHLLEEDDQKNYLNEFSIYENLASPNIVSIRSFNFSNLGRYLKETDQINIFKGFSSLKGITILFACNYDIQVSTDEVFQKLSALINEANIEEVKIEYISSGWCNHGTEHGKGDETAVRCFNYLIKNGINAKY